MDQSAFYNPNLPWSTTPGFYDKATLPLPQCIDLVVNKFECRHAAVDDAKRRARQLSADHYQSGRSDRCRRRRDGDRYFRAELVGSGLANECLNNTTFSTIPLSTCNYAWSPPPTSNPSTLNILSLAQNWAASPSFSVVGPYPAPYPAQPGQLCNDAVATLTGLKPEDWYANDPSYVEDQSLRADFRDQRSESPQNSAGRGARPAAATPDVVYCRRELFAGSQRHQLRSEPDPHVQHAARSDCRAGGIEHPGRRYMHAGRARPADGADAQQGLSLRPGGLGARPVSKARPERPRYPAIR